MFEQIIDKNIERGIKVFEIHLNHCANEFYYNNEIKRNAVRAISYKNGKVLMIESKEVGDFKFPGGGIEKGETEKEALIREVREESGYNISNIGNIIFRVVEVSKDKKLINTRFSMISDYYLCEVNDEKYPLDLDDYEKELGFCPLWISIEEAIQRNTELIKNKSNTKWIKRELMILNEIINKNISLAIT